MNKQSLVNIIRSFNEQKDALIGEIYFILSNNDLKFADLDEIAQPEITKQLIERLQKDVVEAEVDVINISDADDRTNVVYKYDIEEEPRELSVINNVIGDEDIVNFSFQNDDFSDINGFVILIKKDEDNLVLYKKNYPINLYSPGKQKGIRLSKKFEKGDRFTTIQHDILTINTSIDFFKLNGTLFINNLVTLEKFFGFHDVIKSKATACIEEIDRIEILEDSSVLKEQLDDISFARKLTKVKSSSPVLGKIPNTAIIQFAKNHPALKNKLKISENEDKFNIESKQSQKLFVKLLNDDYLQSLLTKSYYDSKAKDVVPN